MVIGVGGSHGGRRVSVKEFQVLNAKKIVARAPKVDENKLKQKQL